MISGTCSTLSTRIAYQSCGPLIDAPPHPKESNRDNERRRFV